MKFIILFLSSIAFFANADSCIVNDAAEQQYNDLHSKKVSIESTLNRYNYFVTINLPDSIENQSLNAVLLVSDSIEEPKFTAPLKVFHEGEQLVAWYSIDASLIRKDYIVVGFGEDCGPSIVKEVIYQR
ncbi:hypothetical protein BIZ38_01185 [Pseudoalteromonas sp. BZK2]|uniref:hypothetical protein n=1 Tax=Pseudoalteromonas sp. BZK2 TaxID=1904458 RepID=UPI0016545233|nr:hypothetical protein [Pseudoalteromonas sp. BZK2]MBC7007057.1 hypothetical protein [Pseudoalteromonas sp. BZK2]